ncbi:MAG: Ku protein [Oscillospiraceae bacterium]|nr:Ku protein [Oscillospiraceae bacterium]
MPATKTVLSFGLVAIPVALTAAVQETDVGFHQLHKADEGRVRYKKVCEGCGKELKTEDIVKAYEFEKDRYVVVTDAEMEGMKSEKEKAVQLWCFGDVAQISPVLYDKAYHALPEPGGEKAFELLRRALLEEGVVAIGKTVFGAKDALLAILPQADGLTVQTLFFADEIKAMPKRYSPAEVAEAELTLARQLVQSLTGAFAYEEYHDAYQAKLRKHLEEKINGQEVVAAKKSGVVSVADLMDALQQSVEQAQPQQPKAARKKKAAAK